MNTQLASLVANAFTLSEESKKEFLEMLSRTDILSSKLQNKITEFLNNESEFLIFELEKLEKEELSVRQERKTALREARPRLQKLISEYTKICEQIAGNFSTELAQIERHHEKGIEKIVHEKIDRSEINAIHQFLNNSKADQGNS